MDIEGTGFIIGLIGAIWMKSSMNLCKEDKQPPELKMIGRETENLALKAFYTRSFSRPCRTRH